MTKRKATDITPYTNDLARTMFVRTADQNYAMARWAFFCQCDVDFFWLSLHAVEKYLKAILLLNGRGCEHYGHNIEKLFGAVLALDNRLAFDPLTKPQKLHGISWSEMSVKAFIAHLARMGDPNNRYMTYGYWIRPEDLFKVDQLVWHIRRYCRPFRQVLKNGRDMLEIDLVAELKTNSTRWQLGDDLFIEKAKAGKLPKNVRDTLFRLNLAFAPSRRHPRMAGRIAGWNPPIAPWYRRLTDEKASADTRQTAHDVLRWLQDHVKLSAGDHKILEDALKKYTAACHDVLAAHGQVVE